MQDRKSVIITGGGTGIGAACVRRFAKEGFSVIINYRRSRAAAKALERELNKTGCSVLAVKADVSVPEQAEMLVERCIEAFGAPEVLVNNAGIALPQKLITETTPREFDRVMRVNAGGTYNCCRAALPHMIRRHSGAIVNISSIWGVTGGSCETAYSASKGAVIALTKALAKEVGPSGIRVNCVAPGVIDTRMNSSLDAETLAELADAAPLCRLGTPEDVANTVWFLASPDAAFITGQVLGVDGGGI
ncbi:MAG: glucose 1-dehydrogenase [Clostridia bacterium]|nr:glucose 1-dehydrogenase [Clostridia bacterium]